MALCVVKTLAEPNLTAISGESATFISGGEFPIPTGVSCQTSTTGVISGCVQTVSFKKFGISLNFTPVVLSEEQTPVVVPTAPTGRILVGGEFTMLGGGGASSQRNRHVSIRSSLAYNLRDGTR